MEAYQAWAKGFDRAKYDIYAVLAQTGSDITWGQFTRQGPKDLRTFSLQTIASIRLRVDDRLVELERLPDRGRSIVLEFVPQTEASPIAIPFTEVALAAKWAQYLETVRIEQRS